MITQLQIRIKELKELDYSYNMIAKELGCSKGTIAYHLGSGQKAKSKVRRALRADQYQKEGREHRNKLLEFSWRYKKMCGCKVCGEKDPIVLEYDHRDRSLKSFGVSEMISNRYSLKTVKEEIKKCDVLCANCHRRKTAKDLNYYTR